MRNLTIPRRENSKDRDRCWEQRHFRGVQKKKLSRQREGRSQTSGQYGVRNGETAFVNWLRYV